MRERRHETNYNVAAMNSTGTDSNVSWLLSDQKKMNEMRDECAKTVYTTTNTIKRELNIQHAKVAA